MPCVDLFASAFDQLNDVKGAVITNHTLYEAGVVATPFHVVKVIARGEYKGKAKVEVQAASASVVAALTKAGASFTAVPVPNLPSTNKERAAKKADKAEKLAKVEAKANA